MEILHPASIYPGRDITFCRDESFDTEGMRAKQRRLHRYNWEWS